MGRKQFALYPRNQSATLNDRLFRNPTAEYRGTPFWSWNNKLSIPQLIRQIDQLKSMGFGGFHIHPRTGMETEYLGEEYMRAVVACVKHARKRSMLAWLYDEDRWPSGFAGGIVTQDPRFRARQLLWTPNRYRGDGTLLGQYEITLRNGFLKKYRRLGAATSEKKVWSAYLETMPQEPWYGGQTNVDTFSRQAIEKFVEVTHDRYAKFVGEFFGTTIPAIFTDEPQFARKQPLTRADEKRDVVMPFTTDFAETYQNTYREDLLDHLPELFWNLPGNAASETRWRYHDHTAERFAEAFGDTIAPWCLKHGIALTGHMLGETRLFSQTRGTGETMRGLRAFHLPGIDVLEDKLEFTTAKQGQSVAHQFGRPGVLSELYGVTNWDFDFVGHKAQGDWQAAMGVTVRVPHLAWVSMAGEAKRDYPAAIGYQSPWFREYLLVEDHFSRVNTVMSRGKPSVRVGMIHPLESYWLCFGPLEQNQPEMQEREKQFADIPAWLSLGLIDFNFISEGLLARQSAKQTGRQFIVGEMRYDAIVLPNLRTIRSETLHRLESFAEQGGAVIFAGVPSLVDAKSSNQPARLAKRCMCVGMDRREILRALEPFQQIKIKHEDGSPSDSILHHIRIDGKQRHIFFCNTDRQRPRNNARIRVPGCWNALLRDTMDGRSRAIRADVEDGSTVIPWSFSAHGHLLITLQPGQGKHIPRTPQPRFVETAQLSDPVRVTLSEPNVLMLDQPVWGLNDEDWREPEEMLRLDNMVRQRLNLPPRGGRMAQPWTDIAPAPIVGNLQLKFMIHSDVPVSKPSLAIEDARLVEIQFDGKPVASIPRGWWVDEAIQTVPLPSFSPGKHELILTFPFTRKTNLEWCYLLGDFGVSVSGRHAKIIAPVRRLAFGDWTKQGLPFYAGNVTYHCSLKGNGTELRLAIPNFKSPLLSVDRDGKLAGKLAFAPFEIALGKLKGRHQLDITAFGNRVNTFGALHNADKKLTWFGPAAWRSTGANWSYEYQLRPMGILVAPSVLKIASDD